VYGATTSTTTLNWLEPNKLTEHIKVTALSTLRILQNQNPTKPSTFPWLELSLIAAVIVAAAVITVYLVKTRKPPTKNNETP
jgi:hypothetical protein